MSSCEGMYEAFHLNLTKLKEHDSSTVNFDIDRLKPNYPRPNLEYHLYKPLLEPLDKGNYEEWLFITQNIEKTLRYLLSAPLQRFWCHVVHDEFFSSFLTNFLQNFDRSHDYSKHTTHSNHATSNDINKGNFEGKIKERKSTLSHLFFCLLLRMSTRKENKESSIPEDVFGEILYVNYIFDVPMMLDICSIYSHSNGEMVKKMISNIFHLQPSYHDDVVVLALTLPQLFDSVLDKCGLNTPSTSSRPSKLTHSAKSISELSSSTFEDLLLYVTDTSHSLRLFFEAHPLAAKAFNTDSLLSKIAGFYDNICSLLLPELAERTQAPTAWVEVFSQCRINWLHVCRHILQGSLLLRLGNEATEDEVAEEYLSSVTSLLEHKRFLADFFLMFPIEADRRLLEERGCVVDGMGMDYVTDAIQAALQYYADSRGVDGEFEKAGGLLGELGGLSIEEVGASGSGECSGSNQVSVGGSKGKRGGVSSEEVMCKITCIQDFLPSMGSSFLNKCLHEFNYDQEKVLNLLLEDNLPPHLASLDRSENLTQGELQGSGVEEGGEKEEGEEEDDVTPGGLLLAQRKNIYDHDEFDVLKNLQNVDTSKIHRGKKEKPLELEDKTHLKQLKPLFDIYGNEFTEGSYYEVMKAGYQGNHNPLDYEDEYDDAFDELEVPARDNDSADELTSRKFHVRPLNAHAKDAGGNNGVGEDEEEEGSQVNRNFSNFLEDPAVLRERAAQNRAVQYQRRHPGSHPVRDVKGDPKGQGQSDGVLKDRHFKEKNKALRGNHNRKNLAGRKNRIF